MENPAGDLRRTLDGPILGRQLLELTRHAVEEFTELDAHNSRSRTGLSLFLVLFTRCIRLKVRM